MHAVSLAARSSCRMVVKYFASKADNLAHPRARGSVRRSPTDGEKYAAWLDVELAGRGTEKGGYGFVVFDTRADDNMSVFVVERNDIDRIIELADDLDLRILRRFT